MSSSASSLRYADKLAPEAAAVVRSATLRHRLASSFTYLSTGERLYWVCQFVSWLFFYLVNLTIVSAFAEMKPAVAVWLAAFMLVGLEMTQRFRLHVRRANWLQLPLPRLIGRVVVAVFFMAMVHTAFTVLSSMAFLGGVAPGRSVTIVQIFGIVLTNLFNMSIVFGVWAGLYFAVQTVRRQRHSEMERLRLETSLKEAELRALKSQVNPHFLFNSLNSLRALIEEDAPRARESVTRLANMLRYSLQSGQLETVPFEDELRIVEDYLALEQIRHENRLRVRWEISDEVRARFLPPMLLQTLVENAVKYGISQRRGGGELVVAARIDSGNLLIRVSNPGDLTHPAAASAAAKAGSSTGVGLRNASERLKLLFGEKARLALRSESPGWVTAEVVIPLASPAP
ncbi:MAG: histidine kinase [Opitutus sp.]|nr:histidine kinase [Opitutus sp.]